MNKVYIIGRLCADPELKMTNGGKSVCAFTLAVDKGKDRFEESNESGYFSECTCDFKRPIKRPPQSWCYVE